MKGYRYPKIAESEVTPKHVFENRRRFLQHSAAFGAVMSFAPGMLMPNTASAWQRTLADKIQQGVSNQDFAEGESLTSVNDATTYNNFYEFGVRKSDPEVYGHKLQTDPWRVSIEGEFENTASVYLEDILRRYMLEERIYRLRCVETWSMVIPWLGFPLANLLTHYGLTSRANYIEFESIFDPDNLRGQRRSMIDWPYREALRIDEAMHPLTMIAVGMYGEKMPNQNGAPMRLVVPWKYGFKSIKSVVAIRALEEKPTPSWVAKNPEEYGFYANVNPEVDHPRWSQARERRIGEGGRRETLMFNGYADEVAQLYTGIDLQKHY
ncbi:protein-methionine-sulfoxide reductase catalytic subunit MsrP [Halomonas qaidamensis]|uniref:Protein-methionine-sulfoxide reductase catalytic subunit MsrP n=1 Tax=Halomonas qaidamensis TaxID=2866211 RepID=A0ABY6JT58_9GAMM|nr:protein-methionine-sulfoxide reductase catalytic subunit MsrP [Halomonas qaidamensis]UYV20506.1 protein-methionine-sulfoxide reductase catalytic subunit MsrP [Halomonas qaidamensis]